MTFRHGLKTASKPAAAVNDGIRQLVTFHLDGEEFAIDILKVQEIIRMMDMTRIPNTPEFIQGVINLRGKVVPVIGLRQRFALEHREADAQSRIVVVEVAGTVAGLVVDSVSEVLRISEAIVEPPPKLVRMDRDYISGVGKLQDRLLMLLDVDRLMNEAEKEQLATAA
jgi:purine-binding chemotaxis protein CheW